jgi:hypothetical protein
MSSKFNPDHYRQGAIEPWDFIVSQQLGFLEGNIVKYITRAGKKDNESRLDDLLKAQAYIHKAVLTELNDATTSTRPDESGDPIPSSDESASGYVHPWYLQESAQPN